MHLRSFIFICAHCCLFEQYTHKTYTILPCIWFGCVSRKKKIDCMHYFAHIIFICYRSQILVAFFSMYAFFLNFPCSLLCIHLFFGSLFFALYSTHRTVSHLNAYKNHCNAQRWVSRKRVFRELCFFLQAITNSHENLSQQPYKRSILVILFLHIGGHSN